MRHKNEGQGTSIEEENKNQIKNNGKVKERK